MAELIYKNDAITALSHMCSEDENGITVSRANVDSMLRSLSPVQPEITQDQLEEYCKKRCLTVITDDLLYKLTSGSKNTATWLIRNWGDDAKCSNCGHTFKDVYDMDNHDRFCRFCGNKMEGIETIK